MLVSTPGFEFGAYEHRDSEIFDCPLVSDALPTGPGRALEQFVMGTPKIDEASSEGIARVHGNTFVVE